MMVGWRSDDIQIKRGKFHNNAERKKRYVNGAYMPPKNQLSVHWVYQAAVHGPAGVETLLVGDLKPRLAQHQVQREWNL